MRCRERGIRRGARGREGSRAAWVIGAWLNAVVVGAALAQVHTTFPATLEREPLLLWLERETDILPRQVVAVTPQALTSVVSSFPAGGGAGPRVVIRAEALSPETQARTGALSWHVSLNADCAKRRVKLGETTGYPERNLIGERRILRAAETEWRQPEAGTALDHAWRAACEPAFAGPFSSANVKLAATEAFPSSPGMPPPLPMSASEPATPGPPVKLVKVRTAPPTAAPAPRPAVSTGRLAAQVGAVTSDADALSLLSGLGAHAAGLTTWVERAEVGGRVWRRALVGGFVDAGQAARFCADMRARGRACFVRPARSA